MIREHSFFSLRIGAAVRLCCLLSCCLLFAGGCLPQGGGREKSASEAAAESVRGRGGIGTDAGTEKEDGREIQAEPEAGAGQEINAGQEIRAESGIMEEPETGEREAGGTADAGAGKAGGEPGDAAAPEAAGASGIRTVSVNTNTDPGNAPQPDGSQDISLAVTEHVPEQGKGLEGRRLIFNGDSRTVGLYCSQAYDAEEFPKHLFYHIAEDYTGTVGSNVFVGKGGEGYVWFSTYGLAFAALQINEDAVLAVWFGVNDPENADSYVAYMNNVSLQWGIPVYYLNVGPCYGSWAVKEPAVQEMNRKLAEGLREEITVIDVYSFIQNGMDTGIFGTQDGLHYNYETCRAIVDFAVREIDADLKSKGL